MNLWVLSSFGNLSHRSCDQHPGQLSTMDSSASKLAGEIWGDMGRFLPITLGDAVAGQAGRFHVTWDDGEALFGSISGSGRMTLARMAPGVTTCHLYLSVRELRGLNTSVDIDTRNVTTTVTVTVGDVHSTCPNTGYELLTQFAPSPPRAQEEGKSKSRVLFFTHDSI